MTARAKRMWLAALVLMVMVIGGYSIGKDMALRDDRAETIAAGAR